MIHRSKIILCLILLSMALHTNPVRAEKKPLWEFSLGIAVFNISDYRGSDERSNYVIPFPYIQYRGKRFRFDREGGHLDIFHTNGVKLDFSLGAGPPVESRDNKAREGMPDLNLQLEIGPQLEIRLATNTEKRRIWRLILPLRAAIATDLSETETIGWIFAPHVQVDFKHKWDIGIAFGPLYATEKYHDYFYQVTPQFATATRPAYDARSGYSGTRLTFLVSRTFRRFHFGAFARYDTLSGSVFEDSPLVKRNRSFMIGTGIAWYLAKSKKMVEWENGPGE
ncbi:MAG: hypothetical protein BMS9Abin11_0848 [Gammaproteobacteria bacterium]|nr:MAG: hypothetical protein BMS9Abin11_0848 [Gammaproteobacteria bacterium]